MIVRDIPVSARDAGAQWRSPAPRITEHTASPSALRRVADEELGIRAAALEAAGDAILMTDRDFHVQYVNQAFRQRTGYELVDVAGEPPQFLVAEVDAQRDLADMVREVTTHGAWRGEVLVRRKDGTTFPADVAWTAVRDALGSVIRFVCFGQDLSARRSLEAELRQSQKLEAVGRLAGGVAHDFNNLLTVILAAAALIEERAGPDAGVREEVRLIRYSAERGAELTRNLLALSRRQPFALAPLDVSVTVRAFSAIARRVLREDITLALSLADSAWVRSDAGVVQEILMNLVANARDAMPAGGTVEISTERLTLDAEGAALRRCPAPGDYVVIAVTDTGVGMNAETRRRVFEPFFTTKPVGRGTGLGLSMVHGLVSQHGGSITLDSEVGHGTTVRIHLPAAEPASAPECGTDARESPAPRRGTETILLAEDEPGLRRVAQRVLEQYGYTVLAAEDGLQALEILSHDDGQIRLIVADVVMPRMGGVRLHRAARKLNRGIRVLLTSGYTARDAEDTAQLEPGVPYLTKPWTVHELLTGVRKVLDATDPTPTS